MPEETFVHLGVFLRRYQEGATIPLPGNDLAPPQEDTLTKGQGSKSSPILTEGIMPFIAEDEGNLA